MKFILLPSFSFRVVIVIVIVGVVGLLSSGINSEPVNPFAGPVSECDDPSIGQETGVCEPECYCIPDKEPCDVCPSLENRVIAATQQGSQDAAFFSQLEVANPKSLFAFDPPGCQPYPLVAQAQGGVPVCEGLVQENSKPSKSSKSKSSKKGKKDRKGPVQCSFNYKEDICDTKRYNLVEENKKQTKKDKKTSKFVTHTGSCGVCSTAQDLAVNLSPSLGQDAFICAAALSQAFQSQDPALIAQAFPTLIGCFAQLGFTPPCAFIWASNGFNTFLTLALTATVPMPPGIPASCLECASTCFVDPNLPECLRPIKQGTCELSACFSCDEDASGPIFKQFGGRTRRNSGVITTFQTPVYPGTPFVGTKRPCSTIDNVKQPSRTCEL